MTPEQRVNLLNEFSQPEGKDTMTFTIKRVSVEEGKSFSKEALDELGEQVMLFIGARIMARWKRSKEPPTIAAISVTVKAG